MNTIYALASETIPISFFATKSDGGSPPKMDPVTGKTTLQIQSIYRTSDGWFYDFADATFKASPGTPTALLTEVSATHRPGWYEYRPGPAPYGWDLTDITNAAAADTYVVTFGPEADADVALFGAVEIVVGSWAQTILSRLPAALVGGRIDADVGAIATGAIDADALATDAVNEIVDQVWDEAIADHSGVGSTGEALSAVGTPATAAAIADAVWDEASADHTDAGSTGLALADAASSTSISVIQGLLLNNFSAGVVGSSFSIRVGDLLPVYPGTLVEGVAAVDLTTASTVQLRWKNMDTGDVELKTAEFVDRPNGGVQYTWVAGDTDVAGFYHSEWIVTWSGGELTTYPGNGPRSFRIIPVLA